MTALAVTDVSKSLGGVVVLRGVSFAVPHGSRLALVGASGSGKSTLLRLIAGFDRIDSGQITLDDLPASAPGVHIAAHRRGIGYVAQDGALFPHLTVRQNISFGTGRGTDRGSRVLAAAELAGLDVDLLSRYPHELSGGQQQRVSLARALAPEPRLILLDEPFSALDTGLRAETRRAVISALDQAQMTTVLVTHDQEEAFTFGDRVGILQQGRLVQIGSPTDVFGAPVSMSVASFLGDTVQLPGRRAGAMFDTTLGPIPIRRDRAAEGRDRAGSLVMMLRPSQLGITPDAAMPNATIRAAEATGQYVQITVELPDGSIIAFPVPGVTAVGLARGSKAHVTVHGDGVVFPVP